MFRKYFIISTLFIVFVPVYSFGFVQTTEGVDRKIAVSKYNDQCTGELKKWHKVTITFEGPETSETAAYNPFMNYRLNVKFVHEKSEKKFLVPGYFAADGDAAKTSAVNGNKWRVHFTPSETGEWKYSVSFRKGNFIAVSDKPEAGVSGGYPDSLLGSFTISPTDKSGRDFRGKGMLRYVNNRYLQFAETGEYFLKEGPDAPENFLAYKDFDGDFAFDGHKDELVKTWAPHERDWNKGDPTWQNGKGKAIIGALNYLSSKGLNAVSMLTMNIIGDDQNVFPFINYETYDRYDISKCAQWEIVFEHADKLGLFLHFKLAEKEGQGLLDNGGVGAQRKLYYRELIARFGHHLALNWNICEENGEWSSNHQTPPQDTQQRLDMAQYFYDHDPYHHLIVIHNGIPFDDLLVSDSKYSGISLQKNLAAGHEWTKYWLNKANEAGINWVVCLDEQNPANDGVIPDDETIDNHLTARWGSLWGVLTAGGGGCEYYFGYKHPNSDLTCQDWRSRDKFWDQCKIALDFFKKNNIPFWKMNCYDQLITGKNNYCFADPGTVYVLYIKEISSTTLDLNNQTGSYSVKWYNPRIGGELLDGSITNISGGDIINIGFPPSDMGKDWAVLINKK